MEKIKDRLSFLRKKARLTQEELAEKLHVSDKVISKWENGVSEPSLADLRNIADEFGVSFDYLVDGKPNENDNVIINRDLTPEQKADDFLRQCYRIVRERNYLKLKDKLIPQKVMIFSKRHNDEVFNHLEGGIFKCNELFEWAEVYSPYIDIAKLIALDDYDLYKAFIDLPATFGELRYQLKKGKDEEGLKATEPIDDTREPWTYEEPKNPLTADDIKGLSDYRFAKEVKDKNELIKALNNLDTNLDTYWYWVKELIQNGAVLQKIVGFDEWYQQNILEDDLPATQALLAQAKENIRKK